MALQTPRRLPSSRPSLASSHINTASSPNLNLASSTAMARKASLQALTGGASPDTGGADLQVGDAVDVPGGMHGTVKFIGSVRSRKGVFAGVELAEEFADRGKNDGDVDGTHYFNTTISGAGIFLPLHRAMKRSSGSSHHPPTPGTPSYSLGASVNDRTNKFSPPTPSIGSKFSQSVGPGARAPSPTFKGKRPSLPRPESPLRRGPALAPPARGPTASPASFSKSVGPPRFTSSPAPSRMGSMGIQKPRTPGPRPYSRSSSRIGQHETIQEDNDTTPTTTQRGSQGSRAGFRPQSRIGSGPTDEEVEKLTKKLAERDRQLEDRDRQLKEQGASLAEMETSLTELQSLIPSDGDLRSPGVPEDADASQLRAAIREKNEKISMLTAEFDAHRADFRSTIDTLEMASTETARVYEEKINRLTQEISELQDRDEDVESVANQLRQLEELVQELEEGLEDARRGEAEARGEVEFLRGEVERGRSELRREREKAAAALKSAGSAVDSTAKDGNSRDIAQRDDEIRGLKAIIHSLSSGPDMSSARASPGPRNGTSQQESEELKQLQRRLDATEREKEELRGLIERKNHREEELERELQKLTKSFPMTNGQTNGVENRDSVISNPLSDRTAIQDKRNSSRDSKGTARNFPQTKPEPPSLDTMIESDVQSSTSSGVLWCEICETGGHDILNCTAMGSQAADEPKDSEPMNPAQTPKGLSIADKAPSPMKLTPLTPKRTLSSSGSAPTAPLPDPYSSSLVPGKGMTVADGNKWCALCERDGHDATACPFEDAF